ncbi:Protein tyrosine kinase (fragment) [Desulfosarcina cetonica]|uniref:CpsD/CapB family tyrosine-protein kinase n=1 Tax=Desulfosarcina cetonica TaxID=90730 RepID=UPI0006CFF732
MNLKKALNKTKQERESHGGRGGSSSPAASPSFPAARSGSDWHAPVYSESKTVSIDLDTAVRNHCVALSADFTEVDYYKVLRTQLRQIGKEKTWNTIMVTSVAPGEGKTVTAINLAATFAREYNQTVLLVDADLRRQSIHRYLGYPSSSGLRDYLEERAPMNDIITWPGIEKFTVISGGQPVEESAELMGSPRMQTLVAELKSRYADRYVIFDVPPVMGGADALAFAPLVDCIIIVVGVGITLRQDLTKALEMLPQEKMAGFVLNRFDRATAHRYGH